jgi:type III restriction enzyme
MQIKYIEQLHQEKAVNAIIDLFIGQERSDADFDLFDGEAVCSNEFTINQERVLENLNRVQKENNIEESLMLQSLDFTIEMETGTGKTFVYIKTILELFSKYGWSKFIIIVPTIAIKEGVLHALGSMEEYFKNFYPFAYDYFEYDSSKLGQLKHFIRDNNLQIMIMTIDSFKRNNTVLNQLQEGFISTPKESLQKTKPILILDEPQNMESELSVTAIKELNPLFTLRYSATHKNYYNLVYTLSSKEALERGLVKQIDVLALSENQTINDVYINVQKIEIDKISKRPVAYLELIVKNQDEFVKKALKIKGDESLSEKTKNPIYSGFVVDEINAREGFIKFDNGLRLELHAINGQVKQEIQKAQISEAIQLHMEKYEELQQSDIKVLSLFFIDRVANFLKDENGWIEAYFCSEFERLKVSYPSFAPLSARDVYGFYFAKRSSGYVDELKNNETDRKLQKEMFDKIMKEKEKLLSFNEKISFIFSHSALKEGWDNPNVFFITTLNETKSEMKKRQILGRGVRLAVDSNGVRIEDKDINRLTVIANESFDEFAKSLQAEYKATDGSYGPALNNKRMEKRVKIRPEAKELSEFAQLWERLKQKTIYDIRLDSAKYQETVIEKLNGIETKEKKIMMQYGTLTSDLEGFVEDEKSFKLSVEETLPNIVTLIEQESGLSRETIIKILEKVDLKPFIKNSDEYIKKALEIFDDAKHEILSGSDGIVYQVSGEHYEFGNVFMDEIKGYKLEACQRGLYEAEEWDSETEQAFIQCADTNFKFFTKLPKRFKIKTPLGNYNPDFAVIKFDESEGSFVVETKGSDKERDLRGREKWKIAYAKKHFKLLNIQYRDKITHCKDV